MQMNNRFSNWGYFGGVLANIGTAITLDAINGTSDAFVYKYWDTLSAAYNSDVTAMDFQNFGLGLFGLIVRSINY